jgi:hypothetical protein
MIFTAGDVLEITSPSAGKKKYHICIGNNQAGITLCLFLNSRSGYRGDIEFECSDFPMIAPAPTGKSIVSLAMMPRYSAEQLRLYGARKIGHISSGVAARLVGACALSRVLTSEERALICNRLKTI